MDKDPAGKVDREGLPFGVPGIFLPGAIPVNFLDLPGTPQKQSEKLLLSLGEFRRCASKGNENGQPVSKKSEPTWQRKGWKNEE